MVNKFWDNHTNGLYQNVTNKWLLGSFENIENNANIQINIILTWHKMQILKYWIICFSQHLIFFFILGILVLAEKIFVH